MLVYQIIVLLFLLLFLSLVFRNLRDYAPPAPIAPPQPEERLAILIPARNEAENIAGCLRGLLAQDYRNFTLIVLDDNSDDGTDRIVAALAAEDARIVMLQGKPIPKAWAGKVWACSQLGEKAREMGADWLMFLDADTRTSPEFAGRLLAHAQTTQAGMVSSFPFQVTGTFPERLVLPMLHFLIITFLPVRMVWESSFPGLVAACGQVELFSRTAYEKVGGHASIPGSFHDGLQLARRVKAAGLPVRLCDASRLISCRMYAGGKAVWNGFTRNAYEGLGSLAALVTMTGLEVWLFLLPYLFWVAWVVRGCILHRWESWGWVCVGQIAAIVVMRGMQARRFGHPEAVALHPLSIVAMVAIQWASFWNARSKAPIEWKGRAYDKP